MKAVAIRRGSETPTLVEKPRPEPERGEALVRTLRVGIDGTDHEVISGGHGGFPAGEDHMVLGHEAVGVVEDPNGTGLAAGQHVVPTVRRKPDGETNDYFRRSEADMAPEGEYVERGIAGAHGYMSEYFTSPADFLVEIPERLAPYGVFVEPLSNTEKAIEHARASRSAFEWDAASAAVLGNGPLGLLTLWRLSREFDRTYCLGRRDRPDVTLDFIDKVGATYIDSRETPVDEIPDVHEAVDFVYEATGYAPHAFQAIEALAPNGVAALLGIPDSWEFEVDGGQLHTDLVLHNKCLIGSVNSGFTHFEAARDALDEMPTDLLDHLITTVTGPDDVDPAFVDDDDQIKAVVEFETP